MRLFLGITAINRLALICLSIVVGGGCAGRVGAQPAGIEEDRDANDSPPHLISVWTHDASTTPEFGVIKRAAETFNRQQSTYKVEVFPFYMQNYDERLRNAAATGTLPSLLELDGPFLYAFAWPGYLRPIDPFVPPELLKDLLPSIIAQGTYEGQIGRASCRERVLLRV